MFSYHSNVDTLGHLTNKYIPLLYVNPGGLLIYNASTFPGCIAACTMHGEVITLICAALDKFKHSY